MSLRSPYNVGQVNRTPFQSSTLAAIPAVSAAATLANGRVLTYRVNTPGLRTFSFAQEQNSLSPKGVAPSLIVSIEVCPDNVAANWIATTAANNVTAVTSVTLLPRVSRSFEVNLRAGIDNFVRITAVGGAEGVVAIDGDSGLQRLPRVY